MKIANINNLSLASVAMQRLVGRKDGLPGLGVLYGPSGFGKTTAMVAVANETRAYYVQLRSAWAKKTLLEKICFEMGISPAKTTAGCLDQICEQLAASQRPLILDEADYLVTKAGMVELVRDIYEGSQAPVMLVGEEQLPAKLKKYERFHNRVLAWIGAQPVSMADAEQLAAIHAPSVKIKPDLLAHLVEISHGSVRRVTVNLANLESQADTLGFDEIGLDDIKGLKGFDFYVGEAPKRGMKL
ncbi:AAA family ATPase [Neisseria dumasiana]|uniref:DNA transposition protein n=1 Tax=Neisseria dumasiana TaxID=1931275 RepID=A0ABX3WMZ1_9NEIS|nr:ATP-binding protein [Neisseria dumasiana]OSI36117.1 DNA transposition protein [Neisseria dumasiana]UOO83516.1 ATP-binding protein [Neisseria dumasiana]